MPSTKRSARLAATVVAIAVGTTPVLFAVGADAAAPADVAPQLAPGDRGPGDRGPVKVDLLAINDFHGALEEVKSSTSSSRGVPTGPDPDGSGPLGQPYALSGGAAYLGWQLGALRSDAAERGAKTVTVAAGDLIGATPLLSAAFHDEPTIETMNKLGLDVTSVGNHEFDEGWRELVRMQNGGCIDDGAGKDNQDSCPGGKSFEGADFDYLSANVIRKKTGKTLFPGYVVKRVGKARGKHVRVAFVGITLEDTPNIVTAAGVKGLEFIDEVEAVRRVLPEIRRKGIKSVVVLVHEGGRPATNYTYDSCDNVTGPGAEIARSLPAMVDVVVSGHTHQAYNCTVQDPMGRARLFTSALSIGRIVTDISLEIDRATGDVIRPTMKAENHIVTNGPGAKPRQGILDLIAMYTDLVAPIANQVLGQIDPESGDPDTVSRTQDEDGESPLGNLIADAQLADDSTVTGGMLPTMAFMNPGGIRADLVENADGNVTYGSAFEVQPFNNYLVSVSLTGQQVVDLLNEQWNGRNEARYNILQIAGLSYRYDETLAAQDDTDAVLSVEVDTDGDGEPDAPIDLGETYRVVTNNFLADGGDGFPTFTTGTGRYFGGLDIDAFADHLATNSPVVPDDDGDRINPTVVTAQ